MGGYPAKDWEVGIGKEVKRVNSVQMESLLNGGSCIIEIAGRNWTSLLRRECMTIVVRIRKYGIRGLRRRRRVSLAPHLSESFGRNDCVDLPQQGSTRGKVTPQPRFERLSHKIVPQCVRVDHFWSQALLTPLGMKCLTSRSRFLSI